jgi:hypothetical protein
VRPGSVTPFVAAMFVAAAAFAVILWARWGKGPARSPTPAPAPAPAPARVEAGEREAGGSGGLRAPAGREAGAGAAPAGRTARAPMDEGALMAKLRQLGENAPLQSIELARDGNRRFPSSPEAPERAFILVKSLVNLRRFHEARDEAKVMAAKYPGSPLTEDVKRHLLVYPLDQPSREEQQEEMRRQQRQQ